MSTATRGMPRPPRSGRWVAVAVALWVAAALLVVPAPGGVPLGPAPAAAQSNNAPTVANAIPDQPATVDEEFSYTFPENTFNDLDAGDTLTYAATQGDGTALPSWLTFTASTRTFSGTPTATGTVSVKVTASDGTDSVSDTFDIAVTTMPAITSVAIVSTPRSFDTSSPPKKNTYRAGQNIVVDVTWNQAVTWDVSATNAGIGVRLRIGSTNRRADLVTDEGNNGTTLRFRYAVVAADTDTDGVAVVQASQNRLVLLRNGATLKSAADGTVNATVTHAGLGPQSGHLVNGSQNAPANSAPTVSSATQTLNAPQLTLAHQLVDFSDADGDTLRFTRSLDRYDTHVPEYFIWNEETERLFLMARPGCALQNITPALSNPHITTGTVTATDPDGATVSGSVRYSMLTHCANFSSATVDGATLAITFDANADRGAVDADEFEVKVAGTVVALADSNPLAVNDRTVTLTLAAPVTGGQTVTVSYDPSEAARAAHTVADAPIAVAFTDQAVTNNSNNVPTVANAIPDQPATVDEEFSYTFPENTFNDLDAGDTLTYAATQGDGTALPSWLTFTASTRTFSGTPTATGTVSVKVTASDGTDSVSDTFDIAVTTMPAITSVAIVSKPRPIGTPTVQNTYGNGQNIVVDVTWNQDVTWDVSATNAGIGVQLRIGSTNRRAELVTDGEASGTAATLRFRYAVVAADTDTDGVEVVPASQNRLVLLRNSATLKSAADGTVNATVTHAGLGPQSGHLVDGSQNAPANSAPTISGATQTVNAPELTLVHQRLAFSDADGDTLRYTVSLDRYDTHVPGNFFSWNVASQNLFLAARPGCALQNITPALSNPHVTTGTVTATDPDGATVSGSVRYSMLTHCANFSSATVDGATLAITFDANADRGAVDADEFEVKVAGTVVALADSNPLAVNDRTVTLTLAAPVTGGQTVTVSYDPSEAARAAHTVADAPIAVAFNDQAVTLPLAAPESATMSQNTLTITFDRNLPLPAGKTYSNLHWAFAVTGVYADEGRPGKVIPLSGAVPNSVAVSGNTVILTFSENVSPGRKVAVAYRRDIAKAAPDVGSLGSVALTDDVGLEVRSFSGYEVTSSIPSTAPPLLVSGQVAGTELKLTFDSNLDAASAPPGSRFSVMAHPVSTYAEGGSDDPTAWYNPARLIPGTGTATVSGKTATVTLAAAVAQGELAVASYRPGNDANPLRAASSGPQVADLASLVKVLDRTPPTVVDSVVAGTTLVLYYSEKLKTSSAPATNSFSVSSVAGSTTTNRPVSSVAMSEDAVTLTLGSAPGNSDTVTVTYTHAAATPIEDLAGNDAPSDSSRAVTNAGSTDPGAPTLAATSPAVGDELVLRLAFDRALDPAKVPPASAFTVTEALGDDNYEMRIVGVAVRGSKLELRMSPGFSPCRRNVSVSYAKPTENALRNVWGTDAAAFSDQAVTNAHAGKCRHLGSRQIPVIRVSAGSSGNSDAGGLSMDFDRRMNSMQAPSPDGFTVKSTTPAGAPAAPVAVESTRFASARQLRLALSRRLDPGEQVTVSYRQPRSGAGLWDADGNQIAPFSAQGAVPGAAPAVTGVEVVSDAGDDDTYAMGETISLQVTFSAAVDVTGAPTLGIDMDPAHWGRKDAVYAGGSGTTELTFTHEVVEPNYSSRGIAVLANTLALNGGAIRAAAGGTDADLAHTGLGHDPAHKVDWQQSPPGADGNRAPIFGGSSATHNNALPGHLVTLVVSKDDFSDPDGDPLTFTLSASRDDVAVPDGYGYIESHGRIWFQAKTACALAALDPPAGDAYFTVITLTATDPDGAAEQATATFRTNPAEFACPTLSSAAVDGATLTIRLAADGNLPLGFEQPAADDFEVKADGAAVSLAATGAVSASHTEIVLTLASPVAAGQTVTVSYTPGDDPMAAAFADQAVTNNTAAPPEPEEPAEPEGSGESEEPEVSPGSQKKSGEPVCGPDPDSPIAPICAAVSGNELTLTFSRDLAAVDDATAATLRWYFLVDGAYHHGTAVNSQSPSQVAVDGATLTLTLGTAIAPGDDVTVTYYGGLHDADGTPVPGFTTTFTTTLTTTQRD